MCCDTAGLGLKSNRDFRTTCLQDQEDGRASVYSPSHLAHDLPIPKKQGLGGGQIWGLFDILEHHQGKLLISTWILHSPDLRHLLDFLLLQQ